MHRSTFQWPFSSDVTIHTMIQNTHKLHQKEYLPSRPKWHANSFTLWIYLSFTIPLHPLLWNIITEMKFHPIWKSCFGLWCKHIWHSSHSNQRVLVVIKIDHWLCSLAVPCTIYDQLLNNNTNKIQYLVNQDKLYKYLCIANIHFSPMLVWSGSLWYS